MFLRRTKNLHNAGQLLLLVLSWEYRVAGVKLGENTSHAPHVDRHAIRHPQDDFRGSIEAGLDVGVYFFVFETTRPKIDDFDFGMHGMGEEDILGLEITMDDFVLLEKDKTLEELFSESSDQLQRETSEIVGFYEFVEVHA